MNFWGLRDSLVMQIDSNYLAGRIWLKFRILLEDYPISKERLQSGR